ncbi:hypothetical protein ACFQE1_10855, partial [Halobium palmae]
MTREIDIRAREEMPLGEIRNALQKAYDEDRTADEDVVATVDITEVSGEWVAELIAGLREAEGAEARTLTVEM